MISLVDIGYTELVAKDTLSSCITNSFILMSFQAQPYKLVFIS